MAAATVALSEKVESDGSQPGYFGMATSKNTPDMSPTAGLLPTPGSYINGYLKTPECETALYTLLTPSDALNGKNTLARRPSEDRRQYQREKTEMFSKLEKPRVRYDVEVITKLVVYTGIFDDCDER